MAGVPVVMSDHCEKRLLVENYGIGELFDETDPIEIARVVSMVLDDRETYAAQRRNCLEAARVLNWEHEEHALRRVFADLLGDRALAIPEITIEPLRSTETTPLESAKYATTQ
jgi:glycosyltransferase involved in cell wall biosynthesis